MVFTANQEKNGMYTFKENLSQPNKSEFIMAMLKESEAHYMQTTGL